MKKPLVILSIIFLTAFTGKTFDNADATVNQVDGLFLFVDSRPANNYKYLGSVKYNNILQGNPQYTVIRDALIKRVKKDWPDANGVIFHFSSGSADKADAIRFDK